mgnify:CR=1 FL=1
MVDVKPSAFTNTAPVSETADFIPYTKNKTVTPLDQTMSIRELFTALNLLTTITSIDSITADYITVYQANGAVSKKIAITDLFKGRTLTELVRIQNALGTALGTTGTINLDFSLNELVTMAAMTGNVTFTTSNLAAGRTKTIRIIGGASAFTFTFPAWKFLGAAAPANLAIGKYAVLTLTSIGTTDAEVVAAYSAQP